jgi:hypothetical protein
MEKCGGYVECQSQGKFHDGNTKKINSKFHQVEQQKEISKPITEFSFELDSDFDLIGIWNLYFVIFSLGIRNFYLSVAVPPPKLNNPAGPYPILMSK